MKIETGQIFTVSKTDLKFIEVLFTYADGSVWNGCFPVYYPPMSIKFDLAEITDKLSDAYNKVAPKSIKESARKIMLRWPKTSKTSETYKVFESLLSAKWECRSCGAGKINDQPAARIRDIKKNGFIISTQKRFCTDCQKKQYHDILLVFDLSSEVRSEFRKPISGTMRTKIINVLDKIDAFSDAHRPNNEFVIDHKFPSQRWVEAESDNDQLSNEEIKNKFQLLPNQTNMMKSRLCDNCVKTGVRPNFLGIKWFYSGDENWRRSKDIGSGCYGCPWFDLGEWKQKVKERLG